MDVYALGATMWKMLVGKKAPEASDVLNNGLPIEKLQSKGVSEVTQNIILKAMAPLKKDRIQSASEFLSLLPNVDTSSNDDEETEVDYDRGVEEEVKAEEVVVTQSKEDKKEDKKTEVIQKPKKRRWKTITGIVAGVVLLISLIVGIVSFVENYVPEVSISSTTSTISGYEYVDLGLSVKWATMNVGAKSPEDYGDYYQWGATSTPAGDNYIESNCETYGKSIGDIKGTSRDVAHVKWGGSWRLPTRAEFQELIDNCNWTWSTYNGKMGYKVTSKTNGNSIFLPAAGGRYGTSLSYAGEYGYYWSSTPYEDDSNRAYGLYFSSSNHSTYWRSRNDGRAVRPVSE